MRQLNTSLYQRLSIAIFLLLFSFILIIGIFAFSQLSSEFGSVKSKPLIIQENRFVHQIYEQNIHELIETGIFISATFPFVSFDHLKPKQKNSKIRQNLRFLKKSFHLSPSLFLKRQKLLLNESQAIHLSSSYLPWFEELKDSGHIYTLQIKKDPVNRHIFFVLRILIFNSDKTVLGGLQLKRRFSTDSFSHLQFTHLLVDSQDNILINTKDPYRTQTSLSNYKPPLIAFSSHLKDIPWDVLTMRTKFEVPKNILSRLFIVVLFAITLIFLIGIPAVSIIATLITLPLLDLRKITEQISKDPSLELDESLDSPDEFGKVFFFLKKIRYQLLEYKDQLENLIQSRTRALKYSVDELKEKEMLIQQEIEFAASIQRGLLPESYRGKELLLTPFVCQMGQVGGDLIDVLEASDFICAYLADASGHGVPASLITMLTKISFEYALRSTKSPEDILKDVNNRINQLMSNKNIKYINYFTLFIIFIHSDFSFDFLSAGSVPAIHFHKSNGRCTLLSTSSPMIGIFSSSKIHFKPAQSFLEPGDKILIFSDGYTGVQNSSGQVYGQDSLIHALIRNHELRGEALKDALYADLEAFRKDAPLSDDLSLLIVEREESDH